MAMDALHAGQFMASMRPRRFIPNTPGECKEKRGLRFADKILQAMWTARRAPA